MAETATKEQSPEKKEQSAVDIALGILGAYKKREQQEEREKKKQQHEKRVERWGKKLDKAGFFRHPDAVLDEVLAPVLSALKNTVPGDPVRVNGVVAAAPVDDDDGEDE